MISVIHKKGTSFKGLGRYLYHDIGADTSERVAWIEMQNLATDDPDQAVNVMIATAMQQEELKRQAGVAAQGRRSSAHVMHYTLSWHEEEAEELTKAEMLSAAKASMLFLGTKEGEYLGKNNANGAEIRAMRTQYADEHQAVFVCHQEDGKSPHVHVMLNRVHPEHGVMLPTTMEKAKLSAFALDYRQAQGKEHYCPQRVINAAKRAEGYVTSCKRKSRQIYELEEAQRGAKQDEQNERLQQVRARLAELTSKKQQQQALHREQTRSLEDGHLRSEQLERDRTAHEIRDHRSRLRQAYEPRQDELGARHQAELDAFEKAQETTRGRIKAAWEVFNTKQWMHEIRKNPAQAMKDGFTLAFSSGMQRQQLDRFHEQEQRKLTAERQREEREQASDARREMDTRLEDRRRLYMLDRNDLILRQDMEQAKQRAEWADLRKERTAALAASQRSPAPANDNAPPRAANIGAPNPADSGSAPDPRGDFNDAAPGNAEKVHQEGESDGDRARQEFQDRIDDQNQGRPYEQGQE